MSFKWVLLLSYLFYFHIQDSLAHPPAKRAKTSHESPKIPLVYHDEYHFNLEGFERFHPYANKKFSKIINLLIERSFIEPHQWYTPSEISLEDLKRIHTDAYLKTLETQEGIFEGFEEIEPTTSAGRKRYKELRPEIARRILTAEKLGAGGTLLSSELALHSSNHWSMNLGGGYHHAYPDHGSGFCLLADAPIALQKILDKHPEFQILIIDLDAHHGDGNAAAFAGESRVHIFDIYNSSNFPFPQLTLSGGKKLIEFDFPIPARTGDAVYLKLLSEELPKALDRVKPQLIFYNAGTDVFENDPLGNLKITREGLIARDEIVYSLAQTRNIPIFSALSGGYAESVFEIIGESIANLFSKGILKP